MNEQQYHEERVEEAEHRVEDAYSNETLLDRSEPYKKHKKARKLKFLLFILFLVIVGFAAAYFFISKDKPKPVSVNEAALDDSAQQTPKNLITEEVERHSSSQFFLSFEYPIDWEIKDASQSGLLTATSPIVDIPLAGGQSTSGKVQLQIKSKSQKLPEFDGGNALAVIDSEKIKYVKPSSAQRGETYVSFLSYAGSASSSLIDGVYITGDFGYTKDQAIPKVDVEKIDPNISIKFFACDGTCEKPLAISPEAWADQNFGQRLKDILKSLTIN